MSPLRRSIPPILDDPRAAGLTLAQRHTLTLLPVALDDHGRGLDDPGRLNGLLWGPLWREHGPDALDADLTALAAAGFITRYEISGVKFVQMLDWDEQQVLSRKTPSRFPAPEGGTRSEARANATSDKIKASVDELVEAVHRSAGKLQDPVVQEKAVTFFADLAGQFDPRLADKLRAKGGQWVTATSQRQTDAGTTASSASTATVQDTPLTVRDEKPTPVNRVTPADVQDDVPPVSRSGEEQNPTSNI